MTTADEIMQQERRERIAGLLPEMERRSQVLRGLLDRMTREDLPYWMLDLARRDLLAVLDAMAPPEPEDEG